MPPKKKTKQPIKQKGIKKTKLSQKQNVNQVVNIKIGDMKKKPKKSQTTKKSTEKSSENISTHPITGYQMYYFNPDVYKPSSQNVVLDKESEQLREIISILSKKEMNKEKNVINNKLETPNKNDEQTARMNDRDYTNAKAFDFDPYFNPRPINQADFINEAEVLETPDIPAKNPSNQVSSSKKHKVWKYFGLENLDAMSNRNIITNALKKQFPEDLKMVYPDYKKFKHDELYKVLSDYIDRKR